MFPVEAPASRRALEAGRCAPAVPVSPSGEQSGRTDAVLPPALLPAGPTVPLAMMEGVVLPVFAAELVAFAIWTVIGHARLGGQLDAGPPQPVYREQEPRREATG